MHAHARTHRAFSTSGSWVPIYILLQKYRHTITEQWSELSVRQSESRRPGLSDSWWTGCDTQIRSLRGRRRHGAALRRTAVCTELHTLSAVHFSDLHLSHFVQIAGSVQSQFQKPSNCPPPCRLPDSLRCIISHCVLCDMRNTPFTTTWTAFHFMTVAWHHIIGVAVQTKVNAPRTSQNHPSACRESPGRRRSISAH